MPQLQEADFVAVNHGSLYLVRCNNEAAHQHLAENVSGEAQWWPSQGFPGLVVEPRYIVDLLNGLRDAGFEVEVDS